MPADPHEEAEIYENEVVLRIQRMRARIQTHFGSIKEIVSLTPRKLGEHEKGTLSARTPIAHALYELEQIEKATGSESMVRMLAYLSNERVGLLALIRIQYLEYMLLPLGLYSYAEIEYAMVKEKAA